MNSACRNIIAAGPAGTAFFVASASAQPEYDFALVENPSAGETVLRSINDQDVACGRIGVNTGAELGFVWSQTTGITIVPVRKPQGSTLLLPTFRPLNLAAVARSLSLPFSTPMHSAKWAVEQVINEYWRRK